jgi:predicted lipoprotein
MRIAPTALLLVALAAPARADQPRDLELVMEVTNRFLVPSYRMLADQASANEQAWRLYCEAPDERKLAGLRERHRRLALAFARVQTFRTGPAGAGDAAERLYFWPQRKDATAKGLAALLQGSAPITSERIAHAGMTAQGIPALERLAFGEDGTAAAVAGSDKAARRACQAGVAIAANVASLTATISNSWLRPGTGLADRLARNDLDPVVGSSMQQAAASLVTDFMTALAVIQDQKLEPVIGASADDARPALAEARGAGLSAPMIAANIEGLRDFVSALEGITETLQRRSWDALLARLQSDAEGLADFPDGASDPQARRSAADFLARLKSVRSILRDEMPVALGLKIGFNGLDGD